MEDRDSSNRVSAKGSVAVLFGQWGERPLLIVARPPNYRVSPPSFLSVPIFLAQRWTMLIVSESTHLVLRLLFLPTRLGEKTLFPKSRHFCNLKIIELKTGGRGDTCFALQY